MNRQPDPDNLTSSHTPIIALQQEILGDAKFQKLYFDAYLPWDPQGGYEPRWYDGPQPENVRLLFLMAEPGAITKTEQQHLSPPITHNPWNAKRESYQQDNYWLKQLYQLCQLVWPEDTEANMDGSLGGSCTFWMSMPPGDQVRAIPLSVVNYFLETYLKRFLS